MRKIAVVTRGGEVMMIGGGSSRLSWLLTSVNHNRCDVRVKGGPVSVCAKYYACRPRPLLRERTRARCFGSLCVHFCVPALLFHERVHACFYDGMMGIPRQSHTPPPPSRYMQAEASQTAVPSDACAHCGAGRFMRAPTRPNAHSHLVELKHMRMPTQQP